MIKRLEVKNYKNLVDFSADFSPVSLLMGSNGTGKSSVFEVLQGIRELVVNNELCSTAFSFITFSRYSDDLPYQQSFELTFACKDSEVVYSLEIEKNLEEEPTIRREEIREKSGVLYRFESGKVTLYCDNHETLSEYTSNANRSVLSTLILKKNQSKLSTIIEFLRNTHIIQATNRNRSGLAVGEIPNISRDEQLFLNWYRYLKKEYPDCPEKINNDLREVIPNFDYFDILESNHIAITKRVVCNFTRSNKSSSIGPSSDLDNSFFITFSQLSDGQRSLIMFYSLLHYMIKRPAIVCIDEPENFLALEEVQPLIHRFMDAVEDNPGSQLIVASHHPEFFNLLAVNHGIVFRRGADGGVVAKKFSVPEDILLTVSELVARGELQ
ncbi:MAG: AAA family ATPase [Candidatus Sumerlaeia bacterium]|nr:AAA family ATPase [Candidatus Sumerlaeia bacterium]